MTTRSASTDPTAQFLELVLGHRRIPTKVSRNVDYWKGPAWEHKLFGPQQAIEAADWVRDKRVDAVIPAYTESPRAQLVAIVHVDARARTLDLIFAPVGPSILVGRGHDLFGVWLFSEPVPWFPGSNLSHALARRIPGASARARVFVPGSGKGYDPPITLEVVDGTYYRPEDLQAALRKTSKPRK